MVIPFAGTSILDQGALLETVGLSIVVTFRVVAKITQGVNTLRIQKTVKACK
jgi:hypothetical protein